MHQSASWDGDMHQSAYWRVDMHQSASWGGEVHQSAAGSATCTNQQAGAPTCANDQSGKQQYHSGRVKSRSQEITTIIFVSYLVCIIKIRCNRHMSSHTKYNADRPSLLFSQGHTRCASNNKVQILIFPGGMVFHGPRRQYCTGRGSPEISVFAR